MDIPDKQEHSTRRKTTQAFPKNSLMDALRIARSIKDDNAGKPFSRLTLAKSLDYSPNSSSFRTLIISSGKFGLTTGGYIADKIELTPLGVSVVMYRNEEEKQRGLKQALSNIPFYEKFLNDFNNNRIPTKDLLLNTLNRDYSIPVEDAEVCYELLMKNAEELGVIEDIKGSKYIKLDNLTGEKNDSVEFKQEKDTINESDNVTGDLSTELTDPNLDIPMVHEEKKQNIFIAHGENKKPLEQLTKFLDKFNIPYLVAIDEPNRALPVSEKIAQIMKECSAGIFIFTGDEKLTNEDGVEISKPNENVIYELGAASVLYGNKIVIFKEDGVTFPSDFSGIGYTVFERDNLSSKTAELLAELIEFKLVTIQVGI